MWRTYVNARSIEIACLLLMWQEISLETINDLTLITEVIVSRSLHFSRTQLTDLHTKTHHSTNNTTLFLALSSFCYKSPLHSCLLKNAVFVLITLLTTLWCSSSGFSIVLVSVLKQTPPPPSCYYVITGVGRTILLATEDRRRQYQLRRTTDVRPGQV